MRDNRIQERGTTSSLSGNLSPPEDPICLGRRAETGKRSHRGGCPVAPLHTARFRLCPPGGDPGTPWPHQPIRGDPPWRLLPGPVAARGARFPRRRCSSFPILPCLSAGRRGFPHTPSLSRAGSDAPTPPGGSSSNPDTAACWRCRNPSRGLEKQEQVGTFSAPSAFLSSDPSRSRSLRLQSIVHKHQSRREMPAAH